MLKQREHKQEEPEVPKYRDRAKEHREDQNPDYEPTELGSFHAVAPPGMVDLRWECPHPHTTLIVSMQNFQVEYQINYLVIL